MVICFYPKAQRGSSCLIGIPILILTGWIIYSPQRLREMAPPQHVMRFYRANRALETIESKQITFIHADKLNDPFDPNFDFQTNFNDDYRILSNYVKINHKSQYDKFKARMPEPNWIALLDDIRNRLNTIRNSTFIFSTIEVDINNHPKNSLYMWSHYADGHRGAAIEFDSNLLQKSVVAKSKLVKGEELDEPWNKVIYLKELPIITSELVFKFIIDDTPIPNEDTWLKTKLATTLKLAFVSKHTIWKPEREWRLMWENSDTTTKSEPCNVLDQSITAIYFGINTDENARNDMISKAKNSFPNAKMFKSMKKKGKFALEFQRIP